MKTWPFLGILFLCLISIAASAFAQTKGKLNPRLRSQRSQARRHVVAGVNAPEPTFRVLMRVAPGTSIAALRSSYPRVSFRNAAGSVVTASVPDSQLDSFETDARILGVEAARKLHPTLDVVRSNQTSSGLYLGVTRNLPANDLTVATGSGVIVGIVDTGIDYHHKDFLVPGTNTSRILYLWDQTDTAGPAPNFSNLGFSCTNSIYNGDDCASTEWKQSDLSMGTARETDTNGHGTHVAGIAAGNGQGGNSPGTYIGMAPQADIIFVKTGFYDDEILDGVAYIAARANLLHKRAVINLSLGGQIDPHDGTSAFDVGIAAISASTPVVVAMGNDGAAATSGSSAHATNPHAQVASLASGSAVTLSATAAQGGTVADIDLWTGGPGSASNSAYTVTVKIGATTCVTKVNGSQEANGASCAGNTVYLYNNSALVGYAGNDTSTPNDREILATVVNYTGFPSDTNISIVLTCTNGSTCGQLDGFVDSEGEGVNFNPGTGYATPATLTMESPATANNVFSVASYAAKTNWQAANGQTYQYDYSVLGNISQFSGWGPTRDGRTAPDVAAPGDVISSALSAQATIGRGYTFEADNTFSQVLADGAHAILAGTSMATPVVTGILATRLQGASRRTVADLRAILQGLARSDSAVTTSASYYNGFPYVNNGWNDAFGAGKVVASPQPISAPTGAAAVVLGASSITWSWNATVLAADAYDIYYATSPTIPVALAVQSPYIHTGLTPNTTYGVLISGEGVGIDGPSVSITTATYALAPTVPPSITTFISSANFSYTACPAASCSGYMIQASSAANFSGTLFSSTTLDRGLTQLWLTGLGAGTTYYVRLANLNVYGVPSFGTQSHFLADFTPVAPATGTFSQISSASIQFSWVDNSNPAGMLYLAEASTASDYSGAILSSQTLALNAKLAGLTPSTSYYFRVQAVGGPFLSSGPVETLAAPPTSQQMIQVGVSSITMQWAANGNPSGTQYRLDYWQAVGATVSVVTTLTSTTILGLNSSSTYYMTVGAFNTLNQFAPSGVVLSAVTLVYVPPPLTPATPEFTNISSQAITINWTSASQLAGTYYTVQISTNGFATFNASSVTYNTFASFGVGGVGAPLIAATTYYFRAETSSNSLVSVFSNLGSTDTLAAVPLAPQITQVIISSITLQWTANGNPNGTLYRVDYWQAVGATVSVYTSLTSSTLLGLAAQSTYYMTVGALNGINQLTPSGVLLSTVTLPVVAPTSPSFTQISSYSVQFSWLDVINPSGLMYIADASTAADFSGTLVSSQTYAMTALLSGLSANTSYYYRVDVFGGPYLSSGPVVTLAAPPLSANVAVTNVGISTLTVAWTANGNPAGTLYEADLSTSSDFTSATSSLTYNVFASSFGLTPNTVYFSRVSAFSRSGIQTAFTALGSTVTLAQSPAALLQPFSNVSSTAITFAFTSGGNPSGTSYKVQLSTDVGFSVFLTSQTANLSATFTGLTSNASYYAQTAAVNLGGVLSAFTTAVATATLPGAPAPATNCVLNLDSAGITVAWLSGGNVTGTRFIAQVSSSAVFSTISSSETGNLFAAFTGLWSNTTYYAQVQAESRYSPGVVSAVTLVCSTATLTQIPSLSTPTFSGVTFTSMTVYWTALPLWPSSAAAEGYRIEASTVSNFSGILISSVVANTSSSAGVFGLAPTTTYYLRVGALNWNNIPNFLLLGSTSTLALASSSGTIIAGSVLTLNINPQMAGVASVQATIPSNIFPAGTQIQLSAVLPTLLPPQSSNEATLTPANFGINLNAGGVQPRGNVLLSLTYDPGTFHTQGNPSLLQWAYYDTTAGLWTLLPSQVNTSNNTLTGMTGHFSLFSPFFVAPAGAGDVNSIHIWPIPWEIGSGGPYDAPSLEFSNLPAAATVRIFNIRGELIWNGGAAANGVLSWNGTNRYGSKVATGTYLAVIDSSGVRVVKRVVVVR